MNSMTNEIFECPQDFWFDETALKLMIQATALMPSTRSEEDEEERTNI